MNVLVSDLTNKYEKCRRLANLHGKVIILKNKQPDAVMLPIDEYERLTRACEKSEKFTNEWIADLFMLLPEKGNRDVYTLAQLKKDLNIGNAAASVRYNE